MKGIIDGLAVVFYFFGAILIVGVAILFLNGTTGTMLYLISGFLASLFLFATGALLKAVLSHLDNQETIIALLRNNPALPKPQQP